MQSNFTSFCQLFLAHEAGSTYIVQICTLIQTWQQNVQLRFPKFCSLLHVAKIHFRGELIRHEMCLANSLLREVSTDMETAGNDIAGNSENLRLRLVIVIQKSNNKKSLCANPLNNKSNMNCI